MKPTLSTLLLTSFALVACGPESNTGSQTPDADLINGEFFGLNVSGLQYRTETQQGTLDEGNFQYVAGETITLSLGDVTLLSKPVEDIQNLDAMLTSIPTSIDALISAYEGEDDVQDFNVAANLLQLLHNLDSDGNSGNGFDLSGVGTPASAVSIDLPVAPALFYSQTLIAIAEAYGTTRTTPPNVSLGYLYDVTDTELIDFQTTLYREDHNNDGTEDSRIEYSFTAEGYSTVQTETDAGVISVLRTTSRDAMGRMVEKDTQRYETDGSLKSSNSETRNYNEIGQLAVATYTSDQNGDGTTDWFYESHFEYNDQEQLIETVEYVESDGIAPFDEYYSYLKTYNAVGLLATEVVKNDYDNDGVIDEIQILTYEYNEQALPVSKRTENDSDADGVAETYSLQTWSYNSDGDETEDRTEWFTVGVSDYLSSHVYTTTYDAQGSKVFYEVIHDRDGDGTTDYKLTVEYDRSVQGHLNHEEQIIYRDGVTANVISTTIMQVPALEREAGYTILTDGNADGIDDHSRSINYEFDDDGNRTAIISFNDTNNDGTIENTFVGRYDYGQWDNAVYFILSDYIYDY